MSKKPTTLIKHLDEQCSELYLEVREFGWVCWKSCDPSGPLKLLTWSTNGIPHSSLGTDYKQGLGYLEAMNLAVKNISQQEGQVVTLDASCLRSITPQQSLKIWSQVNKNARFMSEDVRPHYGLRFCRSTLEDPYILDTPSTQHKRWSTWLADSVVYDHISQYPSFRDKLSSLQEAFLIGEKLVPVITLPPIQDMDF